MKKIILIAITIFSIFSFQSNAQSPAASSTYERAYGEDYRSGVINLNYDASYKVGKNYVVVKLWSDVDEVTVEEKAEWTALKQKLARRNIKLLQYVYKSSEDLKQFLEQNGFKLDIASKDGIYLKTTKSTISTTSKAAMIILEDGKPLSICSGQKCGENIKYFFKIMGHS